MCESVVFLLSLFLVAACGARQIDQSKLNSKIFYFSKPQGTMCSKGNPDFEDFRYPEKIAYCKRNVSSSEKMHLLERYGIPEADWSHYHIDHFISLCLGGDNDIQNLWPLHLDYKSKKDHLERELYYQLSNGIISQEETIHRITSWTPDSEIK